MSTLRPFYVRLLPILILFTLVLVAGCREGGNMSAGETGGLRKISVQLNWFPEPQFGGLYAALENGHFRAAGLDVELIKGGADVPAGQLVASGNTEVAVVSAAQLATLRARGGRATAVFASFQKAPRSVIVREDSDLKTLKSVWEAKGRIMADSGLPWVRWLTRKYGPTGLSFVPYGGSLAPFISKDVTAMQAFATAEPVQLEADKVPTRVFLVADTGYDPYDVVLAVHDDLLTSEPVTVEAFTRALAAGWKDYLANPAATNGVIKRLNPDFSARTLELAAAKLPAFVQSEDTASHRLGWMTAERWNTLLDQLVTIGELDSSERIKVGTIFLNPGSAPISKDSQSPAASSDG